MKKAILPLFVTSLLLMLSACGQQKSAPEETRQGVSGGRSATVSIDQLISTTMKNRISRHAALLGVFISEYISFVQTSMASQGALNGISVDTHLMEQQSTITDPDFILLQAFADALQVDFVDLLNRSTNRQETLDTFMTSLTNVAARANERFQVLTGTLAEIKTQLRAQSKERSDAERDLKKAISKKDFSQAGEQQKSVLEKQQAYAETDLKAKQTDDIISTLNSLLTLYGEKSLAIKQNREVLIAGNRIVDVPGIEELQIIERKKSRGASGRKATKFNSLFEGTGL